MTETSIWYLSEAKVQKWMKVTGFFPFQGQNDERSERKVVMPEQSPA